MKKSLLGLVIFTALVPSFVFASDTEIRANIVARLLSIFVEQVNGLEYIQNQVADAKSPSNFRAFKTLLQNQLDTTTEQITVLLDPEAEISFGSTPTNNTNTTPEPVQTKKEVDLTMTASYWDTWNGDWDKKDVEARINFYISQPSLHNQFTVKVYKLDAPQGNKIGKELVETISKDGDAYFWFPLPTATPASYWQHKNGKSSNLTNEEQREAIYFVPEYYLVEATYKNEIHKMYVSTDTMNGASKYIKVTL